MMYDNTALGEYMGFVIEEINSVINGKYPKNLDYRYDISLAAKVLYQYNKDLLLANVNYCFKNNKIDKEKIRDALNFINKWYFDYDPVNF